MRKVLAVVEYDGLLFEGAGFLDDSMDLISIYFWNRPENKIIDMRMIKDIRIDFESETITLIFNDEKEIRGLVKISDVKENDLQFIPKDKNIIKMYSGIGVSKEMDVELEDLSSSYNVSISSDGFDVPYCYDDGVFFGTTGYEIHFDGNEGELILYYDDGKSVKGKVKFT